MNTQVAIITAIIFISIFLPIFLMIKSGNTDFNKTIKLFNSVAIKNNLKLNQKEFWGNTFIGIDESQQILLYKKGFDSDDFNIVNLSGINQCEILKNVSQKRIDKVVVNILDTIDLKLTSTTNKSSYLFNFYNIDNDYREDFEYKRAEKWAQIINNNLASVAKKKAA